MMYEGTGNGTGKKTVTKLIGTVVTRLTRVREVLGSNLNRDIG
jgi:hypothetical protein